MLVQTNASVEIAETPDTVFDFVTCLSTLPKVFRGYGLIPAIIKADMADGGAMQEGGVRRVKNSDGSVIEEEIIDLKKPEKQTYRLIRGFKFPISLMIRSGGGDWTLTPTAKGTQIDWQFYFVLTSPIFYPMGHLLIHHAMQKAMQQCLETVKNCLENHPKCL